MNHGQSLSLVDTLTPYLKKFNIYHQFRDDVLQELAVAWLEGKTTEYELRCAVIDYYRWLKRISPNPLIEQVVKDTYNYDTEDKEFILNFLSKAVEENVITSNQCNILYKYILGDNDYLIASDLNLSRPRITQARHSAINNLRNYLEVG